MKALRWCSRGDEHAVYYRAFLVRTGASPGRRGLHSLSRPAARQPSAGARGGTRNRLVRDSCRESRQLAGIFQCRQRGLQGIECRGECSVRRDLRVERGLLIRQLAGLGRAERRGQRRDNGADVQSRADAR